MRLSSRLVVLAALSISFGFAQTSDRTFYFTKPISANALDSMTTLIRTVVDIQTIHPDPAHNALVASNGTVDQMMATDWIVGQLEGDKTRSTEFKMAPGGDVIRVFHMAPTAANSELTALVTAIRTIVDAQRLFPDEAHKAIVARASAAKMNAADWLIQQAIKPAGDAVTESSAFDAEEARQGPEVIRVFHLKAGTSNASLTSLVTAIRTIADVQRLFPYESTAGVLMRGPVDKVAAAEWLVNELGTPSGNLAAAHQTTLASTADGVVRVFYVANHNSPSELTALVTKVRNEAQIQRIFPIAQPAAVVLRGRPDQVSAAETLITRFDAVQ